MIVFAIMIILIHCYYGYTASRRPGRRRASPSAGPCGARSSTVNVVDFFLSLALWGTTTTVRIAG